MREPHGNLIRWRQLSADCSVRPMIAVKFRENLLLPQVAVNIMNLREILRHPVYL